jgi:hypothetical protein
MKISLFKYSKALCPQKMRRWTKCLNVVFTSVAGTEQLYMKCDCGSTPVLSLLGDSKVRNIPGSTNFNTFKISYQI